mmetsp:Transcript_148014/g.368920  ORF Transcript_148014/g.368920 Transcript_148014/m.368920 type:complete len:314 (+) Transcript_148014:165-1106(+)
MGTRPLGRVEFEHRRDDLADLLRMAVPSAIQLQGLCPLHCLHVIGQRPALERPRSQRHDPNRDAGAPHVTPFGVAVFAGDDLRRHIADRADFGGHPLAFLVLVVFERPSEAEVDKLERRRRGRICQQVVFRLDIAVRELVIVQVCDALQHLPEVPRDLSRLEAPPVAAPGGAIRRPRCQRLPDPFEEVAPRTEVHHKVVSLCVPEALVQLDDVWMLQAPRDGQLPLEKLGVLDLRHRNGLHRVDTSCALRFHSRDDSKGALAQDFLQLVHVHHVARQALHRAHGPQAVVRVDRRWKPLDALSLGAEGMCFQQH